MNRMVFTLIPVGAMNAVLSFAANQSGIWSILHMCCGWFYLPYWVCSYSRIPELIMQAVGS